MNLEVLMTLAIVAESAPLKANEDGVILVGKTRVRLDTVVTVFNQGATAEEIVCLSVSVTESSGRLCHHRFLSQSPIGSRSLSATATAAITGDSRNESSKI